MAKKLIDAEYSSRILELMGQRHGSALRGERFSVEGRIEGDTLRARVTLASQDRTYVYTMDAAVKVDPKKNLDVVAGLDLCLDFLDWYLGEFFRGEREVLLPLDWQPHRFGEHEVHARGDLKNEVLDDLADAWLRGDKPDVPSWAAGKRR